MEKAASFTADKAHWTDTLIPRSYGTGRSGQSICVSFGTTVEVFDQAALDAIRSPFPDREGVDIDKLPLCKRCEATKAKRDKAAAGG